MVWIVRHEPYPHEDAVERYIEEWNRWRGGSLGSPKSLATDMTEEELIERDSQRELMPPTPPIIFESAQRTARALDRLAEQSAAQRMALEHYHLRSHTLAHIAAVCKVRRGAVRELLRVAHDNFVVFRRT